MSEYEVKIKNNEDKSSERTGIIKKENIQKSHPISYAFKKIKKEFENPKKLVFNIYQPGEKEKAENHRSANRPQREKRDTNNKENKEDFVDLCPCCQLPVMKNGFLEPFKMCDDPKDFSICGIGVSLYFSSIKFIIFIMFFVSICIGSLNIYYSYNYTKELTKVCNIYFSIKNITNQNFTEECKYYYTEKDKYFEYFEIYSLADTFFFRFSSVNTKDYRDLYHKMNKEKNISFEPSIINISLINFICLLVVFLFNLFSIFYLFNETNSINYKNLKPSNYSIFLYNLDGIQNYFNKNIEEIDLIRQKTIREGRTFDKKYITNSKLGFVPKENMSIINQFTEYMMNIISKKLFKERLDINNIVLCYKLEELIKLQKKLEVINEKLSKIEYDPKQIKYNKDLKLENDNRNYFEVVFCWKKKYKLKNLNEKKNNLKNEIKTIIEDSKGHTLDVFIGSIIVTFNSISEKEKCLAKIPGNFFSYFIRFIKDMFSKIKICLNSKNSEEEEENCINYYRRKKKYEAAPEPEDILFHNLETSTIERVMRTLLYFMISIIICFISFIIVAGLYRLQEILDEKDENSAILILISIIIYFVLDLIDFALEEILEALTKKEKQFTYTNFYLSYSIKLTISSTLNSAFVPFLSEIVFTKSKRYEVLIGNLFVEFILNAFLTPILMAYNYCCLFKKFRQYKIKKKGNYKDYSQKELNELYELSDMDISAKYSYLAKTVLMSFFYIPIFPIGIIISFIGFCFFYWFEKYNFANIYKRPKMINRQIAEFYNNFLIIALSVYAVGDYIFLSDVYETKTWSIINIIIFCFFILIPYHQFFSIDYIKFKESPNYQKSYEEALINFERDYEFVNPMTHRQGLKNYYEKLKKLGKIDENINIDNLDDLDTLDFMCKNMSDSGYIPRKNNYNLYFNNLNDYKAQNNIFSSCIVKK